MSAEGGSARRFLSPIEFLDVLQTEYYVNYLKFRIYPKLNDRAYYKRVMGYKKEKIENITSRNELPSIFTDDAIDKQFRDKVFPKIGPPIQILEGKELGYYYYPGTDVRINTEEGQFIGKVEEFDLDNSLVTVVLKGELVMKRFKMQAVTRIF